MKQTSCKLCGKTFVRNNGMWFTTCNCAKDRPAELEAAQPTTKRGYEKPKQAGFYWALWIKKARGTHEENEGLSGQWEIVEVWENFTGEPCEADADEKFGVSVVGVRETQWLNNFVWGFGPIEQKESPQTT